MKKIFGTLIILFFSIQVFSQQTLLSFKNDLKTTSSNIKDVIPIVNEKNGEIVYILADAKNVYAYKINSKFEVVDRLTSEEKSRKFKILIGYDIDVNDDYTIFLTNKKKEKFLIVRFSFESKQVISKEFDIENTESFVQTTTINNQFYLLCSSKQKNELYAYTFKDFNKKKNIISTDKLVFLDKLKKRKTANKMLIFSGEIRKFEENIPNTIEITSSKYKMYERGHEVVFSFNTDDSFTQLLIIDLINFKASTKYFKNPLNKIKNTSKKGNSYLNGDNLFTFSVSKKEFSLKIFNFSSEEEIKTYSAVKEGVISFKNTPIIQEGGIYNNYRELEKTKKFLRKIYAGNIGVSVKKYNKFYHVTLGGYVVQRSNAGMMMPFGGLPIASIGSATIFFNPAQIAFNSFGNNKATRIECLFDEEFNHKKGEIPENAFDKMQDFVSDSDKGGTVFKYKDFYIKTEYRSFSKDLVFKKFKD
ncbi:hypothetical protein [Polaribacter porphyrae]|uniref:GLPGLI family protein n=1 Tax=Polaribacter porphyrae TaxID=1137780 RepID=A0A2S7WQP7_9FLAO|nr:hypothetical protein [Polaribacter porphyrae]PQJ79904.1 hypothetical protein BTO18_12285 [Polaribacter porphyrae]